MVRALTIVLGVLVVIGGFLAWQYGFLSARMAEVSEKIERETAVARADARIREIEQKAETFTEKCRKLRIDARAREIALERQSESIDTTEAARIALAAAAKRQGLPKPSEVQPDDMQKKVAFAGRTLTGEQVYKSLANWGASLAQAQKQREVTEGMVSRMREAADHLESQSQSLIVQTGAVRVKLHELAMQRDLARLDRELAELGAVAHGVNTGELGQALEAIQKEIDESLATIEVLGSEAQAKQLLAPGGVINDPLLAGAALNADDSLWDE